MEKKIRLGIIGIGNMGSGHAKKVVGGECPDPVQRYGEINLPELSRSMAQAELPLVFVPFRLEFRVVLVPIVEPQGLPAARLPTFFRSSPFFLAAPVT